MPKLKYPIRGHFLGGNTVAQPRFRACLKIERGPAAADFAGGQGGEARASPQRAARAEPTRATGKSRAARRVFAEWPVWWRSYGDQKQSWVTGATNILPLTGQNTLRKPTPTGSAI